MGRNFDVFINCPFDDDYLACFEALIFVITCCGYRARCALEDDDSGDIRFAKLCRLIEESDYSIHDLSRTQIGPQGLPRFNMPFELGLMMGAKRFGAARHRRKRACIMIAEPYALPRYLSDISGNDPTSHGNDPNEIIRIVRDHLQHDTSGVVLPGPKYLTIAFDKFKKDIPQSAARAHMTIEETHARRCYRNFIFLLDSFGRAMRAAARSRS